ncbi:MAG: DUF2946 family protein [Hyphomicrobiaceae bacterium]
MLRHTLSADGMAAIRSASASAELSSELAVAVLASMCRPAGPLAQGETPPNTPSPGHEKGLCVLCCCPLASVGVLPLPLLWPRPSNDPLAHRVAWHARQFLIRSRVSERPQVRAPPATV